MPDEQKPTVSSNATSDTSPGKKLTDTEKKSLPTISSDAVSRPESKASQFFRSFLRWAGIALVFFGLGALTAVYLFYIPKSNELKLAGQDLATANAKISELQSEITALNNQLGELSALEETNQTLQTDLDLAQLHMHLLAVLVDVRTAQLALVEEDPEAAGQALVNTAETLTAMQQALESDQAASVDALLSRLELALGELDTNAIDAQADLDVLANRLLQLEETLFSAP